MLDECYHGKVVPKDSTLSSSGHYFDDEILSRQSDFATHRPESSVRE